MQLENERRLVETLAQRHQISPAAVEALLAALRQGQGRSAQFNHPDLGGMGQWMAGGMVMIGDMSNGRLKAAVGQILEDLAAYLRLQPLGEQDTRAPGWGQPARPWWPGELGSPSASGGQNDVEYVYFAQHRRLGVRVRGGVWVYDTDDHRIQGVAQQQGAGRSLTFRSQHGELPLEKLALVHHYDL